ncbi:MAG: hypothetical protein V3T83_21495, partial [Acidobacteriota bacterium]
MLLVITPYKMWRKASWVARIAEIMDEVYDRRDEATELLNRHNEETVSEESADEWVDRWIKALRAWMKRTERTLEKLHPLEKRRFKYI